MNNRLRTVLFVLALAWTAAGLAQVPADAGKTELNLKGVDISVLIQTVSEMTGRSFIVDPKVTGNVTVISGTPMTTDEIWTLFTSVLSVHGYAVTPAGKAWKVLPEAAAVLDGQGAAADGPDAIVTRVVEL